MTRSQLKPLPEAVVASMTLRGLPGVDADIPIGWAPAALTATYVRLAVRPGTTIGFWKAAGSLLSHVIGGVSVHPDEDAQQLDPAYWYAHEVAEYTCELCGRPGRRHQKPNGVYCDSCHSLQVGIVPDFKPRLPLLPDPAHALSRLPTVAMMPRIPAGWASLISAAIAALDDGTGRKVMFEDRGSHLAIVDPPAPAIKLSTAQRILVETSRTCCRHCGRQVGSDSSTPGECDGCRWVQSRGWDILPTPAPTGEG